MKNKVIDRLPLNSEKNHYRKNRQKKILEWFVFFVLLVIIASMLVVWYCQEMELNYLRAILIELE